MHPELLRVHLAGHTLRIPTYGVAAAVGFFAAVFVAYRLGKKQGLPDDVPLELGFWLFLAAVVGSRAAYVLVNWSQFARRPLEVLAFWNGGLVYYGGVLAAVGVGALYVRKKRLNGWRVADVVAPAIALAHSFGRMGCFAAGCCFGKPALTGPGVVFGPDSVAYQELVRTHRMSYLRPHTPALHPVQLYESIGEAAIFLFLLWRTTRKRFDGAVILTYLMLYPLLRFCTELVRGDPTRGYVVVLHTPRLNALLGIPRSAPALLSTSQLVSAIVLAVSVVTFFLLRGRKEAEPDVREPDSTQRRPDGASDGTSR